MTDDLQPHNLATIRSLLLAAFTAGDLRRFCQDRPSFRPIVDRFGPGLGFDAMVDRVVDYCKAQRLFDKLLAEIEQVNPGQYARFAPDLRISATALAEVACPYRGLEPFEARHAEFYFGRTAMVEQLVTRVKAHKFVAVVGASGCGKSSLVRAGLVTALHRGDVPGSETWAVRIFRPGSDPLWTLCRQLIALLEPEETVATQQVDAARLAGALRDGTLAMPHVAADLQDARPDVPHLVLIADQFEELYTECQDETLQQEFIKALLAATEEESITALLTLRADFYGHVLADEALAPTVDAGLVNVLPMNREELGAAIEQPAVKTARAFEPGLVERILADVAGESGNLPLIEFALTELWARQTAGGLLTHDAYEAIGGVEKAITGRAEKAYAELKAKGQAETVQHIFLRLTHYSEGARRTRRQATLAGLVTPRTPREEVEPVVKALADARLLVTGQDEATGEATATVEVSHEALIRGWERLQGWLDQDRAFGLWREKLATARQTWTETQKDKGTLLRGAPLAEAESWLAGRGDDLNDDERTFIEQSLSLRAQEIAEQKEQQRQAAKLAAEQRTAARLRWLAVGLGTFFLVAIALAVLALSFWNTASQERDSAERARSTAVAAQAAAERERGRAEELYYIARSRQLAAQATLRIGNQSRLPLLLSLESLRVADTVEARTALFTTLRDHRQLYQYLGEHPNGVTSLDFSPDGQTLASSGCDGSMHNCTQGDVRLWDVSKALTETSTLVARQLAGHTDTVSSVAFNPADGQVLASGSWDTTVVLWDVMTTSPLGKPPEGHANRVSSVAFSPDGRTLATGSEDGAIILWDVATGQQAGQPFAYHDGGVTSLTFSPDGRVLTSSGKNRLNAIVLWDTVTGQALSAPLSTFNQVSRIAFSPDGKVLASGDWDGIVQLWDVSTMLDIGTEGIYPYVPPLTGHSSRVTSIAISPDGQFLASSGCGVYDEYEYCAGGEIRLWDVATGQPLGQPLHGHQGWISSLAFSPEGQTLASGSVDGTILLWEVSIEAWQASACQIASRNLSETEWQQYLGDEPYRETCAGLQP